MDGKSKWERAVQGCLATEALEDLHSSRYPSVFEQNKPPPHQARLFFFYG